LTCIDNSVALCYILHMNKFINISIIVYLFIIIPHIGNAEIVRYVDEDGKMHVVNTDFVKVPDQYLPQVEGQLQGGEEEGESNIGIKSDGDVLQDDDAELVTVIRVKDGDSIFLSTTDEKVHLLGVNAPEIDSDFEDVAVYYAQESEDFVRRMCEGKDVRIEYDKDKRDGYNRLAVYVYLKDGTFLNAEMIKQGYAYVDTLFYFKYLKEFRELENQARKERRGLWRK